MSATSAPEKTDGDHVELVAFDPTLERETQLKEAYGQAQFDEVLKLDEELLKAEWEACQLFLYFSRDDLIPFLFFYYQVYFPLCPIFLPLPSSISPLLSNLPKTRKWFETRIDADFFFRCFAMRAFMSIAKKTNTAVPILIKFRQPQSQAARTDLQET
jgi:hypothetical protein